MINKIKLATAIIGLTTVALGSVALSESNNITSDKKDTSLGMGTTTQIIEDSVAEKTIQESTTQNPKDTIIQKEAKTVDTNSNTTTTTNSERNLVFNKNLSSSIGFSISIIDGIINSNGLQIRIQANNVQNEQRVLDNIRFTVNMSNLVFTANTGERLRINGTVIPFIGADANNEGTKTWIPYEYNPSITSITATYTFDDGTVASTVLNLS